ncbi:MAG: glycosyltransferase [Clostridia bacterium]|nr:glycosyltransferase [Clostridia bacterium]
MTAPAFTVLLSAYNGAEHIAQQLDSILNQTLPPREIIVRDDGSRDETLSILREYETAGKIRLLAGENVGFLKSFRLLLEAAPEDGYFAFSDQDDLWLPDKLSRAAAFFGKGDPDLPRLYHGAYRDGDAELKPLKEHLPPNPPFDFRRCLTENVLSGFALAGNGALRKHLLSRSWDNIDFHDWLAGALALGVGELYLDPEITAIHRRLTTSVTRDARTKGLRWALSALKQDTNMKKRNLALWDFCGEALPPDRRALLSLFCRFDPAARLKKAFYPARWRYGLPDEIAVRLAMLRGTL